MNQSQSLGLIGPVSSDLVKAVSRLEPNHFFCMFSFSVLTFSRHLRGYGIMNIGIFMGHCSHILVQNAVGIVDWPHRAHRCKYKWVIRPWEWLSRWVISDNCLDDVAVYFKPIPFEYLNIIWHTRDEGIIEHVERLYKENYDWFISHWILIPTRGIKRSNRMFYTIIENLVHIKWGELSRQMAHQYISVKLLDVDNPEISP